MKNRAILLLAMLTGMFACGLIGFFIGRNTGHQDVNLSGYVEPTRSPTLAPTTPTASNPTEPLMVNINTATVTQLDALPGIGPVLAQRIVDYRNTHGSFNTISELTLVEGIGLSILEEIIDYVTVGG